MPPSLRRRTHSQPAGEGPARLLVALRPAPSPPGGAAGLRLPRAAFQFLGHRLARRLHGLHREAREGLDRALSGHIEHVVALAAAVASPAHGPRWAALRALGDALLHTGELGHAEQCWAEARQREGDGEAPAAGPRAVAGEHVLPLPLPHRAAGPTGRSASPTELALERMHRADAADGLAERTAQLEGALALCPALVPALSRLARVRAEAGALGDAEALLGRALRALPVHAPLYLQLAEVLLARGEYAPAATACTSALVPGATQAALLQRAQVMAQWGRHEAARADCLLVLRLHPGSRAALRTYAQVLRRAGRPVRAEALEREHNLVSGPAHGATGMPARRLAPQAAARASELGGPRRRRGASVGRSPLHQVLPGPGPS